MGHGHDTPVHTVIVLIRPKAMASDLTGRHVRVGADGRPYHEFTYSVVKVWEETVDGLLAGGPTTAPLALLTDEADADENAFERFHARLRQPDVDATLARELIGAPYVLCGLRYDAARIARMYQNVTRYSKNL